MAKGRHPEGSEPFDVTLPEGFDLGEHEAALEAAAKQAVGQSSVPVPSSLYGTFGPRTEDRAAWLVATKVGLPLERVTVLAGRAGSPRGRGTPAHDGDDPTLAGGPPEAARLVGERLASREAR